MSFSDTSQAKRYASIAEVAAAECKLLTEEAIKAPEYTNQAKEFAERSEAAASSSISAASQAAAAENGSSQNATNAQAYADSAMLSKQQAEASQSSAAESAENASASELAASQSAAAAEAAVTNTLRVADGPISALPNAADRALKVLSCDASGNFQFTVPSSGSAADVLNQLALSTGSDLVGYESGTVTDELDKVKNKIDGSASFSSGATLNSTKDFIWDEATKSWYYWGGSFPKVVAGGASPSDSGGISAGAWAKASDGSIGLKNELATAAGASLIGSDSGLTVQESLDSISRSAGLVHRKKKVFESNWVFPDYNQLVTLYGYSTLIPQGLALDNDYYYVAYTTNTSGGSNIWHWIAIFDRQNGGYVRCFSLPNTNNQSYPESLFIRDASGSKYIYTTINGNAIGYDITSFPVNMGQATTTVFTKTGVSSFAPSSEGLACYLSDYQDVFVVQVDWSGNVLGIVTLSDAVQTLTSKPSPYTSTRTKVQSRIMSNGKLIMVGGAQFKSEDTNQNKLPAFAPSYIHTNVDGTLSDVYVYDPISFLTKVAGVTTAHVIENEGVANSPEGKIYSLWYYEILSPYAIKIFIVEENSTDDDSVDLKDDVQNVLLGGGFNKNIIRSYDNTRFNPYTGVSFSNCESVCELMRNGLIDGPLTLYVASTFYFNTTNTYPVPSGSKIVFTRINAGTVFMEVTSGGMCTTITSTGLGQLTFNKGQIGGNNTDPWFGTGDFAILGMGGLGVVATKRSGTSQSVHHRFENANGVVGTIETTSNATLYNTASDLRLKNIIGDFDGLSIVKSIVEDDGAKEAEFKNDEGNHYPMLIAQSVYKHMPSAVSVGEDGIMRVDYSKLMPVVLKAIYELLKQAPQ